MDIVSTASLLLILRSVIIFFSFFSSFLASWPGLSPFHGSSSEDASGLVPIICLACEARVMLTANLWVDKGLVKAFSLSLLQLIQRGLH